MFDKEKSFNFIVFDIETYSPSKLDKIDVNEFRVSVTGAYISWIDKYLAFLEEDTLDFIELLKQADLVVGYNHLWFDLPVLQKYTSFDLLSLPSYDIMVELEKKVGFKMKLDDVCKANFDNDVKTDSYEKFKHYYWDKKWAELIDYCMNDVRLTNEVFLKILRGESIKYHDLQETLEIFPDQPKPGKVAKLESTQTESIF